MENNLVKHQKGIAIISWVIILLFLGFCLTITVRVGAAFFEHLTVNSVLKSFAKEENLIKLSKREIEEKMKRRFQVNNIKKVSINDLTILKSADEMSFTLEYEIRVKAIANVDAIASFRDEVVVK